MQSKLLSRIIDFFYVSFIQLSGLILTILAILIFLSLLSYAPDDPNFIVSNNVEIKNILGLNGSLVSDFILQSIGIVSFFLCVNIFVWGVQIIIQKNLNLLLTKIFFSIIYIISSCATISIYYGQSFWLVDNGNGGFVGNSISQSISNHWEF